MLAGICTTVLRNSNSKHVHSTLITLKISNNLFDSCEKVYISRGLQDSGIQGQGPFFIAHEKKVILLSLN